MFKVLTEGCEPTKGTKYSACVDLYASEDVVIGAGETAIVGLGVCIDSNQLFDNTIFKHGVYTRDAFLSRHYLALHPRSSLRAKGLIANTGIIDLDYQDEIKIIIHNPLHYIYEENSNGTWSRSTISESSFIIKKGDRIAQIMLCEHKSYMFGIESEDERNGGFGSSRGNE